MGLFDFFKRRRTTKGDAEAGGSVSPDAERPATQREEFEKLYAEFFGSSLPKARREHYNFAHQKLRRMVLDDPDCFELLHGDQARAFLSHVWHRTLDDQPEPTTDPTLSFDDLQLHRMTLDGRPTVVVELPKPRYAPEAYFVGIVWSTGRDVGDILAALNEPLYYTLELSGREEEGPMVAVLCQWWGNGTHSNTGQVLTPDLESFVKHLTQRLGGGDAGVSAET